MRERIALANFEAQRLLPLSRRLTRQPANSFSSGGDLSRSASSFGRSAGSFWPSPSSVAIHGARAAFTPVRMAVLWPLCCTWRSARSSGTCAICACSTCQESSFEWSST